MTSIALTRVGRAWERFWFAPTDPSALALLRIAYGTVITLWALSIAPDLGAFFAPDGIVGEAGVRSDWEHWSLLDLVHTELAVAAIYLGLLAGSLGLLLGYRTRISAAAVFVALTSLENTDPFVFNSGDSLLRLLALYLGLAPSSATWSIDNRRRRRSNLGQGPESVPAWPLRLIQIQLTVMYLGAVWAKLEGPTWRDGTAAYYALRLPDLVRVPAPDLLHSSLLAAQLATYGTIAVELGLAVLIWHRRTRLPALLAGVLLHLSIDASIRVGFFTLAVFTAYLSFCDPAAVRRGGEALARLRARAAGRFIARPRHLPMYPDDGG